MIKTTFPAVEHSHFLMLLYKYNGSGSQDKPFRRSQHCGDVSQQKQKISKIANNNTQLKRESVIEGIPINQMPSLLLQLDYMKIGKMELLKQAKRWRRKATTAEFNLRSSIQTNLLLSTPQPKSLGKDISPFWKLNSSHLYKARVNLK